MQDLKVLSSDPAPGSLVPGGSPAFLNRWLALFRAPSQVTSDNGTSFVANVWKDMMIDDEAEHQGQVLGPVQTPGNRDDIETAQATEGFSQGCH